MLHTVLKVTELETSIVLQVTEKTFQEMYINVGMANREKRPRQERDDIRFTHIAIPTFFCNIEVCSVGTCINFVRRWCVLPMSVGSKLLRGGSPVKASVG